ncbi:MAG: hypothetical protein N5P05_003837 [Chroococcopsis gigantea SAG 12.99]|jgi:hypothetical protein|nr:HEAT repeat domain-containing protein [Chlorogloea purpurea SAG 13.99]MDV3002231.1 hypothetical protein [Chroococcopsis gigantea SAG 12.99]
MIKSPFCVLSLIFISYWGILPLNGLKVSAQNFPYTNNAPIAAKKHHHGHHLLAQKVSSPQSPVTTEVETPAPTSGTNSNSIPVPLIIGSLLLSLALVGILISVLSKYKPDLHLNKEERLKRIVEGSQSQKSPKKNWGGGSTEGAVNSNNHRLSDDEYEVATENSLQVQSTSKIPNPDLILSLLDSLSDEDPRSRRRAIWKLAQVSDSRAMQPMVEAMMDGDSYERSLILEALAQICTRTLRPMNQALAISLQDKNPQVRKNAIRDLTRIYDIMSQISQLIAHAIDDNDPEVQETAKWAMRQLNIQLPPRLDIGPMHTVGEPEDIQDSSYTETNSTEA